MEQLDLAAVAAVRAGDRDAFRLLVERHSRSVFRLAYRMTGNEQDAEEVVQEAFLRAYRGLNRFESRANFSTWLYRIASNCALDLLERRKHQPEPVAAPAEDDDDFDIAARIPSSDPSPERLVRSGQMQRKIAAALAQLSPSERTAFSLRHFEGRSIEEIAATLRIREGAAKNAVFRAVQKLRRSLEPAVRSLR